MPTIKDFNAYLVSILRERKRLTFQQAFQLLPSELLVVMNVESMFTVCVRQLIYDDVIRMFPICGLAHTTVDFLIELRGVQQ